MDAARPDALGAADSEEGVDLPHDLVEAARLDPARGLEDVRVHRVARPDNRMLGLRDGTQERRERVREPLRSHPDDERQPAGDARRVQSLAELEHLLGRRRRPELDAERVVDAGEELDVSAVALPRPLTDPEHVRGAVVPVAGQRVAPRQPLLVVEQEALVARPDIDLVQLRGVDEVDPTGAHERERPLDLDRDRLVALAFGGARGELLVPHLHLRQVGEAALREGAEQVERDGRLVVGAHHALGVGDPRLGRRLVAVDHVAEEGRELDVADALGGSRARLCELAGDPPHLHEWQRRAVDQHDRHLEQDLQLLADRDRREVVEGLGAVARLEEEGAAGADLGERGLEITRLAGEDERRQRLQLRERGFGPRLVRPLGLVPRGAAAP